MGLSDVSALCCSYVAISQTAHNYRLLATHRFYIPLLSHAPHPHPAPLNTCPNTTALLARCAALLFLVEWLAPQETVSGTATWRACASGR